MRISKDIKELKGSLPKDHRPSKPKVRSAVLKKYKAHSRKSPLIMGYDVLNSNQIVKRLSQLRYYLLILFLLVGSNSFSQNPMIDPISSMIVAMISSQNKNKSIPLDSLLGYTITKPEKKASFARIKMLNKGINRNPDSAKLYVERGKEYKWLKLYSEAESDFKKARRLKYKNEDEIFLQLGKNSYLNGNTALGRKYLERYHRDNVHQMDLMWWQALAHAYFGEHRESVDILSDALSINPHYNQALLLRAYSYSQIKEYNEAIDDYEILLELDVNRNMVLKRLGEVYYLKKNYRQACETLSVIEDLKEKEILKIRQKSCKKSK